MPARIFLSLFLLLCSALGLLAQKTKGESSPPSDEPQSKAEHQDYILQASDLLHIQVFQEEDLTREVRISQEYTITLPLIGTIDLKGKTLRQCEEMVRSLYNKDFLVNPQVTIMVKEYSKRTVDVQGQVGNPGAIEFPQEKGLSLVQAVTRAGGFTRLADKKRVMLTRHQSDGSTKTYTINVTEIIEGNSRDLWILQKDDSIFVPERIL
jgi:polysaccharide biosynthesis/export protein